MKEESIPASFVADVRQYYQELGTGNLDATMMYSCSKYATADSALLGWDFKPRTGNRENRWVCETCGQNWLSDTDMAVVVHHPDDQRGQASATPGERGG